MIIDQASNQELNDASSRQPRRLSLFNQRPLYPGEDEKAYDELLAGVLAAVKPADVIEQIWVHDIVDLSWEARRWRRLKAELLNVSIDKGVRSLNDRLREYGKHYASLGAVEVMNWAVRTPKSITKIDDMFAAAGLNKEAVMAETLAVIVDQIRQIDRLTAFAEARRNAALREIDRHREALAEQLQRVCEQIEEAQFEVVDAPSITGGADHVVPRRLGKTKGKKRKSERSAS